MSNRNVVEEIRAALARDSRIAHAVEIAVGEREGIVTLRGTVSSPRQRQTAVEIAKSVSGVRTVNDGLRIDPRDHTLDDEIRGAALQALLSDDAVPERVDADVANGWLTLKGEEVVDIGSDHGNASHPLSVRLSPRQVRVTGDPDRT